MPVLAAGVERLSGCFSLNGISGGEREEPPTTNILAAFLVRALSISAVTGALLGTTAVAVSPSKTNSATLPTRWCIVDTGAGVPEGRDSLSISWNQRVLLG